MGFPRTWTDDQLINAVASATSLRGTCLALGVSATGGQYTNLRAHIARLSLSTDHWLGQGHRRGKTGGGPARRPLDQLKSRTSIRRRVLQDGLLDYRCSICGLSEWQGQPLSLTLDHINGVNDDHRVENLRWVCPNCDSQLPTFAGRNKGAVARTHGPFV